MLPSSVAPLLSIESDVSVLLKLMLLGSVGFVVEPEPEGTSVTLPDVAAVVPVPWMVSEFCTI